MTRNEFLTEKMGIEIQPTENWGDRGFVVTHEKDELGAVHRYIYSPWEWFGKLWNWAKGQEWWYSFIERYIMDDYNNLIHPDRFADAVAKYLGWEEGK